MKTQYLSFGDFPSEHAALLTQAFSSVASGTVLSFPKGTYEVGNETGDDLYEALLSGKIAATAYDTWRDNKNIVMSLSDREDIIIDGNGATLRFRGLIQPFAITRCSRVVIRNLTIDWVTPLFATGTILSADENGILLRPDHPLRGGEPVVSYQDFDDGTVRPLGHCIFEKAENVVVNSDGTVLLRGPETETFKAGSRLLFRHIYSYAPVFHLYQSREITFENVTIRAGVGMGVIAHGCQTLTFRSLKVEPAEGRLMSVNCDATHFIGCRGDISFDDCSFEGMGDDAANVHGFYLTTIKTVSPGAVLARLDVTTQDFLMEAPSVGDVIEFVHKETLLPYEEHKQRTVTEVTEMGEQTVLLQLDAPLPDGFCPGDRITNLSRMATLRFENSTVKNIRGRAVLIQTRGAVVRNCLFEGCTGEGVHVNTAIGWSESAATRDVVIEGNTFRDCGYGFTKYCDAVGVVVGTECDAMTHGVHRGIRIVGNTFIGERPALVLTCCEEVEVRDNRYEGCSLAVAADYLRNAVLADCTETEVTLGEHTERVTFGG